MNNSILKIAHVDKELTLEQTTADKFALTIYEGAFPRAIQINIIELAALRNHCSKFLDTNRRLKREREKHTGQKEIDLDR